MYIQVVSSTKIYSFIHIPSADDGVILSKNHNIHIDQKACDILVDAFLYMVIYQT